MGTANELLSVKQAAEILHLSPRAVLHRIQAGSLPATKLGAGTSAYVLNRADVEAAKASAA